MIDGIPVGVESDRKGEGVVGIFFFFFGKQSARLRDTIQQIINFYSSLILSPTKDLPGL